MLESNDKYFEILNDIKRTLVVTRNKIVENANKELILMYYSIGSKLIMNNKWGSSFIDNLASNFDKIISSPNNERMKELLKNPYIFDFITADKELKEVDIEKELTSNITKLLLELGSGFAFVGRQYHLEIEDEDYYIDLLFYNLKLKSYVVIELKTTKFKPEYIGKLNFYLNAVDKFVKSEEDNPTFGILLCKSNKKITAELSLKDVNKPIGVSEYKILSEIPEYLESTLPSIEDIEKRLEANDIDEI